MFRPSAGDPRMESASDTSAGRARPTGIVVLSAAAFLCWFVLFSPWTELSRRVHAEHFWAGMTISTLLLGGASLLLQRSHLRRLFRFERRFVAVGLVHAVLLYALSRFGVWLFATFFSWVVPQIEAIYATRAQLDPLSIGLLLTFIIAPMEEVFWRGYILDRLRSLLPGWSALAIAVALYTLAHIWALNPMLLLAAFVLGAHWSWLYWRFRSLVPGIISHAVWDVAIFVVAPVTF